MSTLPEEVLITGGSGSDGNDDDMMGLPTGMNSCLHTGDEVVTQLLTGVPVGHDEVTLSSDVTTLTLSYLLTCRLCLTYLTAVSDQHRYKHTTYLR